MAMLENVFSWSKSRDEQFRECQRKYFYDKYLSWGGWDAHAPKETRLAYVYKNLKNRWAWKGETVHHVIEDILKSLRAGSPVTFETALTRLTEVMRRDYRSSKAKKYFDDPKKNIGLFEHEYEKMVSDDTWKKIHDSSAECLKNFYNSALYKELLQDDKTSWLVIEDLEEYDFDGAKIYVKLDFARKKNGIVEIYDWKTGKDDSAAASVQIGSYAVYAMQKWKIPLEEIRAYLFNLSTEAPIAKDQPLSKELIDSTREFMKKSIGNMKELLEVPEKNIPLPRENFKFTPNVRLCDFCSFYKICDKFQKKSS